MTQDFLVNVADLLDREAPPRDVEIDIPVDWGLELSTIQSEPPLHVELTLSPLPSGILGRGAMRFRVEHNCRRCLTPYTQEMDLQIAVLFEEDPGEDAYPIEEAEIDLESFVRDEALLALPLLPECPDGCAVVVTTPETDLNTDLPGDGSPFAVLRDLLPPGH